MVVTMRPRGSICVQKSEFINLVASNVRILFVYAAFFIFARDVKCGRLVCEVDEIKAPKIGQNRNYFALKYQGGVICM